MEELNKLQNEIDELSSKQADLENDVQHDIMKLEAVKLFQKLNEVYFDWLFTTWKVFEKLVVRVNKYSVTSLFH